MCGYCIYLIYICILAVMNLKVIFTFLLVSSFSLWTYSFSWEESSLLVEFPGEENSLWNARIFPQLQLGSQENSLGIAGEVSLHFPLKAQNSALASRVSLFHSSKAAYSYYGIPQPAYHGNTGLALSFAFGGRGHAINADNPLGYQHNIGYFISYICSSDGTSQPYGGVTYTANNTGWQFRFQLDNDDAYAIATDKFRTTKGVVGFSIYGDHAYGVNLGFRLWTGRLDGTKFLNSLGQEEYSLNGYGGEYSHGILYLQILVDHFGLSFGYDSERIRDLIQNGWHDFYGRPSVPLVDREDRFFIQFSYNEFKYDY